MDTGIQTHREEVQARQRRDLSDMFTSQRRSRIANNPDESHQEEARKDPPLGRTWPCHHLDLRVLGPRTVGVYMNLLHHQFMVLVIAVMDNRSHEGNGWMSIADTSVAEMLGPGV